eukprot:1030066-Prorocentrum_minimum.AAC.1
MSPSRRRAHASVARAPQAPSITRPLRWRAGGANTGLPADGAGGSNITPTKGRAGTKLGWVTYARG